MSINKTNRKGTTSCLGSQSTKRTNKSSTKKNKNPPLMFTLHHPLNLSHQFQTYKTTFTNKSNHFQQFSKSRSEKSPTLKKIKKNIQIENKSHLLSSCNFYESQLSYNQKEPLTDNDNHQQINSINSKYEQLYNRANILLSNYDLICQQLKQQNIKIRQNLFKALQQIQKLEKDPGKNLSHSSGPRYKKI